MAKLSDEQMKKGRERFLAGNPEIKREIDSLNEAVAEAMCTTLERYKEVETMKALEKVARAAGIDSHELFLSCVADTAEELQEMLNARNKSIKSALGLD